MGLCVVWCCVVVCVVLVVVVIPFSLQYQGRKEVKFYPTNQNTTMNYIRQGLTDYKHRTLTLRVSHCLEGRTND